MISFNKKYGKFKSNRLIWGIGAGFFLLFFSIYLYGDICHTTIKGITFWETLFEGRVNEYYSYFYPGVENSYYPDGHSGVAYDFLFYIIFAAWNFPLWCFERLTGLSFLSTYGSRLYAKSIVLFFAIVSGILVKKIIEIIDEKQAKRGMFFFMYSPLLILVIVVIGGYDIISVFFTLLGIYYYLEDREVPFIFSFAVAAVCKMFALLVLIPLILLRQKNIIKVVLQTFGGISVIIASKLIVGVGGLTTVAETGVLAHANLIDRKMFPKDITILQIGTIPLFFAATFILWWICWKKKETSKIEVIYIVLLSMSIFAAFVDVYPYWIILLVPYLAIIMALNSTNLVDNFILETIFSIGYMIYQIGLYPWCFGLRLVNKMFGVAEGSYFRYDESGVNIFIEYLSEFSGISIENVYSLFACCFIVGLGLFLYENRPKVIKSSIQDNKDNNWYLDWIRLAIGTGVMLIPLTELLRLL